MKYKNFNEWLDAQGIDPPPGVINLMADVWSAAIYNSPDDPNAAIGQKIHNLLNTMKDAMKIDCTCDKSHIKRGLVCRCARSGAVMQSTKELGAYLQKLRKELK